MTYISHTLNVIALKITAIKLLHGSPQVGGSLVFDKTNGDPRQFVHTANDFMARCSPSAVGIASRFRVHHVKSGLTRKVF